MVSSAWLVPLQISYAYEVDGDDDVLGIVVDTTLGQFAMWLGLGDAVQLAGQVVEIAEHREVLRERYAQRAVDAPPSAVRATSATGLA